MDEDCCRSGYGNVAPEGVADWIMLGGVMSAIIPFLIANGVVFAHRKRKYFQTSGWELILGNSITGLIWIAAALVVNQHFRRDRAAFFGYCALWTFWFQLTFGICAWLAIVALRLHYIYVVASSKTQIPSLQLWILYFPLMLAPAFIFSIVATVEKVSHHPCEADHNRCIISHGAWRFCAFLILPPVYFCMILFVLIRVRKNSDFLLRQQYQQTKESASMAFVLYLLMGTTYWSKRQNNREGRCFLTFCVCSLVLIRFWVHTGWPVYLCLYRRGDAMDKYEEELRRHGAASLQHRGSVISSDLSIENESMSESFTFDGQEAIVLALGSEQAQCRDLKFRRETLHRRINHVKAQLEDLKRPVVPYSQSFVGREAEKVLPDSTNMTRHLSLEPYSTPRYSPGHFL